MEPYVDALRIKLFSQLKCPRSGFLISMSASLPPTVLVFDKYNHYERYREKEKYEDKKDKLISYHFDAIILANVPDRNSIIVKLMVYSM